MNGRGRRIFCQGILEITTNLDHFISDLCEKIKITDLRSTFVDISVRLSVFCQIFDSRQEKSDAVYVAGRTRFCKDSNVCS